MKPDPLDALKAADPLARVELNAVDPHAFEPIRQAIPMTPRANLSSTRQRRTHRVLAGTAALALLGGGAAYAISTNAFHGGTNDGLTCMTKFIDPSTIDPKNNPTYGGAKISDDPIADCNNYAARAKEAPVPNPVAFRYHGFLIVAPADQKPAGAVALTSQDKNLLNGVRLNRALEDLVDPPSRCMTASQATEFASQALTDTHTTGWTIQPPNPTGACYRAMARDDRQTIEIRGGNPSTQQPTPDPKYAAIDTQTQKMLQALRTGISQSCLNLSDATRIADQEAAEDDRVTRSILGASAAGTPVLAEVDNQLKCSTVDVQPGGIFTIVVRGPETTR